MLDGKKFINWLNTDNGDVDQRTIFYYSQQADVISATYQGGVIKQGSIIGKMLSDLTFEIYYQHITQTDELRIGHCISKIELLDNGLLKIKETWEWLNGDLSKGHSELVEIQ